LNRVDRHNALTWELIGALKAVLATAAGDIALRAVVLSGGASAFCRGDDEDMGEWPSSYAHRRPGGSHGPAPVPLQDMLSALRALPKPTVAAIRGAALGSGLDLACACDIRVCTHDSALGDPRVLQAEFAVTGITHVLPRLVGQSQAMRMLLLGEQVGGREAQRIGLVYRSVDSDTFDGFVDDLAARIATMATRSYAIMKQQIIDELDMPYDTALMHSMAIRQTNVIEDRAEGQRSFLEKRPARFTGR